MKRMTTVAVIVGVLMSASIGLQADASWLSKTLDKLNQALGGTTSTSSVDSSSSSRSGQQVRLPRESDYSRYHRPGEVIGEGLSDADMSILGVKVGTSFQAIERSLGEPTSKDIRYAVPTAQACPTGTMSYGGVTFEDSVRIDAHRLEANFIEITNRDAVTARDIAVGDSVEKVLAAYGWPTYVRDEYQLWFYGEYIPNSDYLSGIQFYHDGEKITKIRVMST